MSDRNLIIICQAPADVQYVVNMYNDNSARCNSIFVINVFNVFLFLKSLDLDVEIYYIPYKLHSFKNLVDIMKERKRLNSLWSQYKIYFSNSDIYFFSRFEDWITGYFLNRISVNCSNTIYYYNHYDNPDLYTKQKVSVANRIRLLFLKFITGVTFKGEIAEMFPEYSLPKNNCQCIIANINNKVSDKFCYKLTGRKNCLLFLSGAGEKLYIYTSYIKVVVDVVDKLYLMGYDVYLKPNPRVGLHKELRGVKVNIIPEYIPSEFIDTKHITLCLGFDSTALVGFAKNNIQTFSLLPMLNFISKEQYAIMEKYLLRMSGDKICFAVNLDFIK